MQTSTPGLSDPGSNPVRRLSGRYLLIGVAAIACILCAFAIFGVLGGSSITAILTLLLILQCRRRRTPSIPLTGIALLVGIACILATLLSGWLVLGIGPVYSRDAWPNELTRMAEIGNADPADTKVVSLGGFVDAAHVWRLSIDPSQIDAVAGSFGMGPVPSQDVPSAFRYAFPRWWRPKHKESHRYLATSDFPADSRGPDGNHFFAMYDPEMGWLYVWYKSNF